MSGLREAFLRVNAKSTQGLDQGAAGRDRKVIHLYRPSMPGTWALPLYAEPSNISANLMKESK